MKKSKKKWIDGKYCISKTEGYTDKYGREHPASYLMDRTTFNPPLHNDKNTITEIEFPCKITSKGIKTMKPKVIYNGPERRRQAAVFGCLEMHHRDVGEFFGGLFRAIEEEKQKIKNETEK